VDKCTADDFDLDLIEFRNVQVPYSICLKLSAEKCSSPTYEVDKCTADDFDLDLIEFRNVQVCLKLSADKNSFHAFSKMPLKNLQRKTMEMFFVPQNRIVYSF
jgi:hypothetical protein